MKPLFFQKTCLDWIDRRLPKEVKDALHVLCSNTGNGCVLTVSVDGECPVYGRSCISEDAWRTVNEFLKSQGFEAGKEIDVQVWW